MNIAYISNDSYAPYTGISILSLFENNKQEENIDVYIVDCGVLSVNRDKIMQVAELYGRSIRFMDKTKEFNYIKEIVPPWRGHYYSARGAFPELLLPDVDRILSLGSDMIIHSSIKDLYNTEMSNFVLAGVPSPEFYNGGHCQENPELLKENPYMIAGDMWLYNMDMWKRCGYTEKIESAYKQQKHIRNEMSALLAVVDKDHTKPLHPKFNYWGLKYSDSLRYKMMKCDNYFTNEEITEAHQNPIIIHYADGKCKPWTEGAFIDSRFKQIFLHYKDASPWRDLPPEPLETYYYFKTIPFKGIINKTYFWLERNLPFIFRKQIATILFNFKYKKYYE